MVVSKGWWKQKQDCNELKGEGVTKWVFSLFKRVTVTRKTEWGAWHRREEAPFSPSLPSFLLRQVCGPRSGEEKDERYKREYNLCLEVLKEAGRMRFRTLEELFISTKKLSNVFFWGRKQKQKRWLKICLETERMKAEAHSQGVVSTSWEMFEMENTRCLFPSPPPCSQDIRGTLWVLAKKTLHLLPLPLDQAHPTPQTCASEHPHFGVPDSKFSKSLWLVSAGSAVHERCPEPGLESAWVLSLFLPLGGKLISILSLHDHGLWDSVRCH